VPVVPRAAFSHCRALGRDLPAHSARAHASRQKTAPGGDYSFSDRLAGLDVLFQPEANLQPLRKALLEQFAGQSSLMVKPGLQEWVILETPYRKPHLTQVLKEMERETPSPIRVNRPPGRLQFAPGVTVDIL
jgi:hypothetical protein